MLGIFLLDICKSSLSYVLVVLLSNVFLDLSSEMCLWIFPVRECVCGSFLSENVFVDVSCQMYL